MTEPVSVLDVMSNLGAVAVSIPAGIAVIKAIALNISMAEAKKPENQNDRELNTQLIRGEQLMTSLQKPWALVFLGAGIGLQFLVGAIKLLQMAQTGSG